MALLGGHSEDGHSEYQAGAKAYEFLHEIDQYWKTLENVAKVEFQKVLKGYLDSKLADK